MYWDKLLAVLKMIRIQTAFFGGVGVVMGQWITVQGIEFPSTQTLTGAAMIFFMLAFGNVSNDLSDISTDAISNPGRPLITGLLTRTEAAFISLAFGLLTILFGLAGGPVMAYYGLFGLVLVTAYNLYFKNTYIFSNIIIGVWGTIPLMVMPFIIGSWTWKHWIYLPSFFLMLTGNEIVAGINDIDGDRLAGRKTAGVALGEKKALILGGSLIFIIFPVLSAGLYFLSEPILYFVVLWGGLYPTLMAFNIKILGAMQDLDQIHSKNYWVSLAYILTGMALAVSR